MDAASQMSPFSLTLPNATAMDIEVQAHVILSNGSEPSTSAHAAGIGTSSVMTRYATPPDGETPAARKARLHRKKQAEYRQRKRNSSSARSISSGSVLTAGLDDIPAQVEPTPSLGMTTPSHIEGLAPTLGNSSSRTLEALPDATSIALPTVTEPSTSARAARIGTSSVMTRYATPPDGETPAARKARLHRKKQAEYRQRKRNSSSARSIPSGSVSTAGLDDIPAQVEPTPSLGMTTPSHIEGLAPTLGNSSSRTLEALPDATSIALPTVTEPSTSARAARIGTSSVMTRYATPPDGETPAARKARLHRKKQAEYRQRKRNSSSARSIPSGSVSTAGLDDIPAQVEPTPSLGMTTPSHIEGLAPTLGNSSSRTLEALPDATSIALPTVTEPSTSARAAGIGTSSVMTRYATPPDGETPAARKARLNRKHQAEYRQRLALNIDEPPVVVPTTAIVTAVTDTFVANSSNANVPVTTVVPQHRREYEAYRRRQLMLQNGNRTYKAGLGYHDDNYDHPERHLLGQKQVCQYCSAMKWPGEAPSLCCNSGQIVLPQFDEPPAALRELYNTRQFMQQIRAYNNAFAFTSMGASVRANDPVRQDEGVAAGRGVYNYRIQGALCHRIGGLAPPPGRTPLFAQLYFHDAHSVEQSNATVDARVSFAGGLNRDIVTTLQNIFNDHNPLAGMFRHAYERMAQEENLQLRIHARLQGVDHRRYNRPTADEVAGIFVSSDNAEPRDIVLENRGTGSLMKVSEHSQLYDAMQYPLLHPYAEVGWSFGMRKAPRRNNAGSARNANTTGSDGEDDEAGSSSRQVSPREYAAYRISYREGDHSLFHRAGRLLQQYCVDQYCKMEAQRLRFQRENQAQLRADAYAGIMDLAGVEHVVNDLQQPTAPTTLDRAGTRVILAPSFVGSDRYMRAQYQDAMAIVRAMGKPDLFITITCNPSRVEITQALLPRQQAADRPDLTTRVFREKLKAILADLSAGALGLQIARIHVIEFQKRGLPHAHCLLILGDSDKPRSAADYDKVVSAEIPDPVNAELHETIRKCMMHGPCGPSHPQAPCMKDGVCSKHFPKAFCEHTRREENGYPLYRRRNNGRTVKLDARRNHGVELDNRYVVPYNPWLVSKYNCHINVEVCTTVTSVKYLYKYVYKGHDRVAVSPDGTVDEIQRYIDARYISASESCWRIMRFELQAKSHTVVQLPIHLENHQRVTFNAQDTVEDVLNRGHHTMLTRFFELAAHDDYARTLTYQDLPLYYRYAVPQAAQRLPWQCGSGKHWIRRVRSGASVIGRMVSCSMALIERYCMRLLLCYRKGPTSFQDLRTIDGTVCSTYKQAATLAGLLQDDYEWDRTIQDAVSFQMPAQLRHLFALILSEGFVQNTRRLWNTYADHLCEDFRRSHRTRYTAEDSEQNRILRDVEHLRALQIIDRYLRGTTPSKDLSCFPDMPQLNEFVHVRDQVMAQKNVNALIDAERSYSIDDLEETLSTVHMLNAEQRVVYDTITAAVDNASESDNNFFFLDGPGGTGKSYLLEKILAYTRRQSKIALATASSGIAALLLTGGKTVHSMFKLPLTLDDRSQCAITVQSKLADLIRQASLIVWDEASMGSRYALEAIDRALQDVVGVQRPFGAKVMLLCGDFRQILPIVPKGTDAQIISQCLKKSPLWEHCQKLSLRVNMRVQRAPNSHLAAELQEFAEFLLSIGEGRHPTFAGLDPTFAKIPFDMMLNSSTNQGADVRELIDKIYPEIERWYKDPDFFTDRAILSPLNVDVTAINNAVMMKLPEVDQEYLSVDTLVNPEEHEHLQLPPEYLNSLNISGIPLHSLKLKQFAPVLLLRNLHTERGLCNGTRLQIVALRRNCIHARILTGKRRGDDVLLPRIYCDSNDAGLPFQIRRKQFPVQVCFAMTINKSQGQSLHHLGLYLPTDVFAHGQLYVALSRVTSRENVAILIQHPERVDEEGVSAKNIVYREIIAN